MKYNYIIIEDEKGAFDNLKTALKSKTNYVLKAFATDVKDGIVTIMEQQPDLIFLDVELGNENGFDLIQELKNAFYELPPIIMTTGHDNYAKNAVNNQILYFLSKPIDKVELTKALEVFEKKYADKKSQLFIRKGDSLGLVKLKEIMYLQADVGYTKIYMEDGTKQSIPKTLKYFETKLNQDFLRIHRGYIINKNKIKEIKLTEKKMYLESLQQCAEVEIGKNYVQKLRNALKI